VTKTVKIYEQGWVDRIVVDYLTNAGVGEPVMTLLRKTPAASIRWLSLEEIEAAGLATAAVNPAHPILSEGLNGLDERRFDEGARPLLLNAAVMDRRGSGAILALTYRRGGGAVELALTEPGKPPASASTDWTLAVAGGEPLALKGTDNSTASGLLPRVRFCALGRDGSIVATPSQAPPPAKGAVAFDLASAASVQAMLDEACP